MKRRITLTLVAAAAGLLNSSLLHGADVYTSEVYDFENQKVSPRCLPLLQKVAQSSGGEIALKSNMLAYRIDPNGGNSNLIDFSHAGYQGGGIPLPIVPNGGNVVEKPLGNGQDDSVQIQEKIDALKPVTPNASGFRAAVLLKRGTYTLKKPLSIKLSGVVLRGEADDVVLELHKTNPGDTHGTAIEIMGEATGDEIPALTKFVTENTRAGSRELTIHDNSFVHVPGKGSIRLKVGDKIRIKRRVTNKWLEKLGMDSKTLTDKSSKEKSWIKAGSIIEAEREIKYISGNHLILDAPLTDSIDLNVLDSPADLTVVPFTDNRIYNIGVERISFVGPDAKMSTKDKDKKKVGYDLITVKNARDVWVKDVTGHNFRAGVTLDPTAKRLTVMDSTFTRNVDLIVANTRVTKIVNGKEEKVLRAQFGDMNIAGQQALLVRVRSEGASYFPLWTHNHSAQLNAALGFQAIETAPSFHKMAVEPHDRWATALLLDNLYTQGNVSAKFRNWGGRGSGHGWAMAFGVKWHSLAANFESPEEVAKGLVHPPGAKQWDFLPATKSSAEYAAVKKDMNAADLNSLYLAQLCQRKGPEAVEALRFRLK